MMNKYKNTGLWLLIVAFFLSLLSVPNIGNQAGIEAAYNIGVYAGISLFILFTLFYLLNSISFLYTPLITFSFVLVTLVLLVGLLGSDWVEVEYTFYASVVGIIFLFTLTQYQLTQKQWYWFFYAIMLLALIQILISIVQRFDTFSVFYWWTGYFPFKFHDGYLGSLQQRNMLANFVSFAVVISIWLVLQSQFSKLHSIAKLPILLTIFLGVFIVVGSGSRAGLLGTIFGLLFLLFAVKQQIKIYFKRFIVLLFLLFAGWIAAIILPMELSSAGSKLVNVVYGSDVRLFLYTTGWHLFLENFWFGVGIGNYSEYLQEFVVVNGLFLDSRIVNYDCSRFTHPHNELLFWLIQVGFVGSLLIFVGIFLVLKNWWQQGRTQFLLYLGLSFPLVLQTLVSYPLTLSATHYFLLLTFLVFSLNVTPKQVKFSVSKFTVYSIKTTVLVFVFWLLYGVYVALMSAFEVYYFQNRLFFYKVYPQQEVGGYFHNASKLTIYRDVVLNNMENLITNALLNKNIYDVKQYLIWYEKQNKANLSSVFHSYAVRAKAALLQDKI